MPINIIDGFNLNKVGPIDIRMVATGSSARNAIAWKYDGLKVFDTSDRKTYIWATSSWTVEGELGLIDGYVPKFSSAGLTNSIIYATSSFIGLNTNDPKSSMQINSAYGNPFSIDKSGTGTIIGHNYYSGGSFSSDGSSYFEMKSTGALIIRNRASSGTFIDTIYITATGSVGIGVTVSTAPAFKLDVRNGLISSNSSVLISNIQGAITTWKDDVHLLIGNINSGTFVNAGALQVTSGGGYGNGSIGTTPYNLLLQPAGGQVYFGGGSVGNPVLSFTSSVTTGIYSPAVGDVAISIVGSQKVRLTSNGDFYADIHNISGAGTSSYLGPIISSGTYNPVAGFLINCTVSTINKVSLFGSYIISPLNSHWSRVGNVVTVSGNLGIKSTTANIATSFQLSLPIPTSFSSLGNPLVDYTTWRLAGAGAVITSAGLSSSACHIYGNGLSTIDGSSTVSFQFFPPVGTVGTTMNFLSYTYTYLLDAQAA